MTVEQAGDAAGIAVTEQPGINGCSEFAPAQRVPGAQLTAFGGRLAYILIYKRGPATTRGIRVGDRLTRLRRRYHGRLRHGKTASLSGASSYLFADQRLGPTTYTLEFDIRDRHVLFMSAATRHTIETFGECS